MKARVLPREEWAKLEATQSGKLLSFASPADVRFVVLEDEGKIVGSMAVLKITHLENMWLDPAVRTNLGAARTLLRETLKTAKEWTESWVMASIGDDTIAAMVERAGGKQVPVDTYILPVE